MTDEERARELISKWEKNNGYLEPLLVAAFAAVRDECERELWAEFYELLCRDGWDMSLERLKAYCLEQARPSEEEG